MSIVLIFATSQLLPLSTTLLEYKWLISSIFISIGLIFIIAGLLSFHFTKTTGNPNKPELVSSLVTSGIYHTTRNPMYVGLIFLLLAWGVWLGSFFSIVVIVIFQQYTTRFQIIPEERAFQNYFLNNIMIIVKKCVAGYKYPI
ncbi:MAG TPA: isoprenylcysteine carboxylmethyltransferase family protein [Desulfobacterales bacterium]|nr:isoprenylcysteine carboxylmethyltransferase family protein [Desulfobacterales bacterium]